jgi:UDP-2,3-diacylglucosamine hydrolase
MELHPDGLTVEHQGLRLYLHHGDGLYPDDHGYRLLKKVLRNRFIIALFRLVHPDLAARIARITSSTSRKYLAPPPGRDEVYANLFRAIADTRLAGGFDAAVYGHSHVALAEKRGNGTLVLLGDWIARSTYAVLEHGVFTLHEWPAEEP